MEKTYFSTEEAFPTVLRRSEVVGVEILEISPVENALNEVESKTKELAALNLKYQALAKTAQHVSTNALAMCLNSAVDAPVNTGISAYRQTFFDPEYVVRNPERAELVEKLKAAIDEQVRVSGDPFWLKFIYISSGYCHRPLHETAWPSLPTRVHTLP